MRYRRAVHTDVELLLAWRGGDATAARELFDRWFDRLYRFFATKTHDGIDDLVQETLLACVESRENLQDPQALRAFIFAVARRRLYRRWRDQGHGKNAIDFGLMSVTDLRTSPSGVAVRHEQQRQIYAAMQRIPVDQQIALELYYWEDMPAPAIAQVLDQPEGTIRSRLRRARDRLREELGRLGGPHLAADELDAATRQLAVGPAQSTSGS
jgi:RNA polymerase sigma-70 factor (ECF subfamily)